MWTHSTYGCYIEHIYITPTWYNSPLLLSPEWYFSICISAGLSWMSKIIVICLKSIWYESQIYIRYLNQIFGPTISSWRAAIPSLAPVKGKQFYQCREGPDQCSIKLSSHKLTLKDIRLTKPDISKWHNHSNFHCHDFQQNEGNLRKVTGTNNVGQFKGGKVLVTYLRKHRAYRKYFWMPLPLSPSNVQDFKLMKTK